MRCFDGAGLYTPGKESTKHNKEQWLRRSLAGQGNARDLKDRGLHAASLDSLMSFYNSSAVGRVICVFQAHELSEKQLVYVHQCQCASTVQ